ncbi:MAG: hypothetical protein KatS3mg108_2648 [Isosphaeraceae bacterium]|jgi:competence protein ComEA|nr:MAG: hypothetical protein KatS3mg108_2648 [Isosphaeraceae bacterium]
MMDRNRILSRATYALIVALGLTHRAEPQSENSPDSLEATQTPDSLPESPPPIKVDLNRATADELLRLPQLGKSTVERIIRGRPYRSVDDLARVGVAQRTIAYLREISIVGPPTAPPPRQAQHPAGHRAAVDERIDLNTADAKTLQTLPGVGPTLSRALIDHRPYSSIDDLRRVPGISPDRFAVLRNRVVVHPPDPAIPDDPPTATPPQSTQRIAQRPTVPATQTRRIDLNTATQDELESLPSIGPAKARAIIEHRPFRSIEDVMRVPGIKQGTFDRIRAHITIGSPPP